MKNIIKAFLIATLLQFTIAANACYSTGDRGGILRKFSYKGWLVKSWEGELALTTGGMQGEIWKFSVSDDDAAKEIQTFMRSKDASKPVTLSYCQVYLTWWMTTTDYHVLALTQAK